MNDNELRQAVLRVLGDVAPDVDPDGIDPHAEFRDQFDFDSMDLLNLAIGLKQALGVTIPERDYPRIASLDGCLAYLREQPATGTGGATPG